VEVGGATAVEEPSSSELYHCRKNIYDELLKAGYRGLSPGELYGKLQYGPETVRKSLNRLERDGLVKQVGGRYVTTASLRSRPAAAAPQGSVHTVSVEKNIPRVRRSPSRR